MRFTLLLVLVVGYLPSSFALNAEFSGNLKNSFAKFLHLGRDRQSVGHKTPESSLLGANVWSDQEVCDACELGLKLLLPAIEDPNVYPSIVEFAKYLCIREKWFTDRVCNGAVDMFKEEIFAILPVMDKSPHATCSTLLKLPCGMEDNPVGKWWNITLPPQSAELRKRRANYRSKRLKSNNTIQILHLSDMHMDPWYVVGSEANCPEPLCCRADSPPATNASSHRPAGSVGDYNCDTNPQTMMTLLNSIVQQHHVDLVYITGDLTPHDVWNQTRERHNATMTTLINMLKQSFKQIPVYIAVGNHEGMPVNAFPTPATALPQTQNMSWLYDDIMIKNYIYKMGWLPADTAQDITKTGSYSTLFKPGWRVISLNDNYCNSGNWWMLRNDTDPQGELQWLVKWLYYAETHNETVHLLMHIPTGDSGCFKVWSWNFYSIMFRFHETIAAQFSGHTHDSYYTVYYDDIDLISPTGINYIGPSITPYTDENPAYQLLTADAETMEVLDYDIYYVDIPSSNIAGSAQIKKLYSAMADLGLADLSPLSWHQLAIRMQTDDVLFQKFYNWLNRDAGQPPCDAGCKRSVLCELHVSRNDPTMCDKFVPPL